LDPTGVTLNGFLHLPDEPNALVIFAHGSSIINQQNITIAHELNQRGIATLLVTLLTPTEDELYENRHKITILGDRLIQVTQWLLLENPFPPVPIGYFGDGTGAALALQAAALMGNYVRAVVSCSGQPELARNALGKVEVPVLLIVGELDIQTIYMNQIAYDQLRSKKEMITIEDASHSFDEPGTLEKVAKLTANWMEEHLVWPTLSTEVPDIKEKR
jgi:dienelactone hydrolase